MQEYTKAQVMWTSRIALIALGLITIGIACTFIGVTHLEECTKVEMVRPYLGTGMILCLVGIAYMFYYIVILLVYLSKQAT